MAKILLLAIAFAAAFWLLRHRRRAKRDAPPSARIEDMVGCVHCGLHLPREEVVVSGNRYFCSAAHEQEFNGKR